MIAVGRWFERKFRFDFPIQLYPNIVERLRGTPIRLEGKVVSVSSSLLTRRQGSSWSIQENIGHLLDLDALHAVRLQEFLNKAQVLTAADLKNQRTFDANHNAGNIMSLLKGFRKARSRLVASLEDLDEAVVSHTAIHPRLQQPMNLLDMCFFIAEHDDQHLARISEIIRLSGRPA